MLFALPTDLSLSILQDWLADVTCLTALDAAAGRSVRSEYLGLVAHPAFVLPAAIVITESKLSLKTIAWINTRVIKLSALVVHASIC